MGSPKWDRPNGIASPLAGPMVPVAVVLGQSAESLPPHGRDYPVRDARALSGAQFPLQFPADLATSWGIEMENLVLGWYILVETGSVLALTLFWALLYLGTLWRRSSAWPGDRSATASSCAACAPPMRCSASSSRCWPCRGAAPGLCLIIGALVGADPAVRPGHAQRAGRRDDAGRDADGDDGGVAHHLRLGADLRGAVGRRAVRRVRHGPGLSGDRRLVSDRVSADPGACRPAGRCRSRRRRARRCGGICSEGLAYVWDTPSSLAALWLAFLVNLTAFPLTSGLLPYVARDVYRSRRDRPRHAGRVLRARVSPGLDRGQHDGPHRCARPA